MSRGEPEISGVGEAIEGYQSNTLSRRQFLVRLGALGVSATAAGAILAACSPDDEPVDPDDVVDPDTDPDLEPVRGGILREGYDLDFSMHDPIRTDWYDPAFFAIYEAVLTNDPDGETVAQLATDWSVSDDGMVYTLTIPSGRTFHSGDPVDAESIAEYFRTIQEESFVAVLAAPVDTYEAPDENTVEIHMQNPWIGTLGPHKTGYWRIINIDAWREGGGVDPDNPYGREFADGTGPFTHEEWVPGSHVQVARWDDYPGSDTPWFENDGPAYLDGVRWTFISEAATRAVQLETDDIDTLKGPAMADVERLENNPDITVYRFPEWSGYMLTMNQDLEFWQDREVRQAVAHAVDRDGIVEAVFFGEAHATYGPFPETDRFYDPQVEELNQFDPDLARSLLDEAGWVVGDDGIRERDGERFSFDFAVQDESINEAIGTAVSAQLAEIGLDARVNVLDRASLFEAQAEGVAMSIFYWLWPIPIDVLTLFTSEATIPVPNWARVAEPRIVEALDAWQSAGTEEEAQQAQSDFQLAWAEELPYVSMVTRNAVFARRNHVHGWMPTLWNLYPYYNDVWIEQ